MPKTQADAAKLNRENRGRVGRITQTEDGYVVDEIENVNDKWYIVNTPEARQGEPDAGTEDTVIFDDDAYDAYAEGMKADEEASLEENYDPRDVVDDAAVPRTEGFSGTVTDADVNKAATAENVKQDNEVEDGTGVDEPQTEVDSVKQESETNGTKADVQPNRGKLIRNLLLLTGGGAAAYALSQANKRQKEEDKDINTPESPPITPAPRTQ